MKVRSRSLRLACTALGAVALTLVADAAQAQINYVNMFRTASYTQTGNGNALALTGYYFTSELYSIGNGNFASVNMTYPGAGSPQSLAQQAPFYFFYSTNFLPSKAAMDAAYPMGTYTYTTSGGNVGASNTSFVYNSDAYPQSLPYLTGSDFTSLQGMNASSAFTFHFNPFITGGQASESYLFFTIYDNTTNGFVYDAGFQPATTTQITLGANTLQAGHNYNYEVTISNRNSFNSPGAAFPAQVGYDFRTTGNFITAAANAPEPGTLALLLPVLGTAGILVMGRRRR